ncbi:MAG: helix-turn-helix domain-containing protein [Armatimonadota bacterium]|nr:helix-turn-helix domain-containing protein [Armatimonadota bacterium]
MDSAKRERLEAAGFKIGTVTEFLNLSPEEEAFVELKLALSAHLKQRRQQRRLSQASLAKQLHSSQSRVAKMEAGDPTVSVDLLIRALLASGSTTSEIGEMIATVSHA